MTVAINQDPVPLDPILLATYQRRMRGELYAPDAGAGEAHRCAHNQRSAQQPAFIARCLNAQDVALVIGLARELHLELVVHNGGHSQIGQHVGTDSLLIDLSQLRQIMIDPLQQIARAQPGATNRELAQAAAVHGLAITTNVLAFEVITAEGAIITASAHEHADLFSSLFKGSDTFGVVTALTYRLQLSPPARETDTGDNAWTSQ
jgi:FAD/FMN-containing dehydrogenase